MVTTRWPASSTWTPKASTSPCCTRLRCSPGSKRPTSSAPRVVPTTTGCPTTAPFAPDRLYPVALVPLQDPDAAITEMRHTVAQLGAKAVMIRPQRYIDDRKLNDPMYDPFWAAAAELDCPIGVHPSPSTATWRTAAGCSVWPTAWQSHRGTRAASRPHQCVRPPDGRRLLRTRRHLRTASGSAGHVPRGDGRVDRAHAAALRPPVRDLRQLRPDDVAERGVRPSVHDQLRPRRGRARLHRRAPTGGQDPLGVGLSAPRRQSRRRRRAW